MKSIVLMLNFDWNRLFSKISRWNFLMIVELNNHKYLICAAMPDLSKLITHFLSWKTNVIFPLQNIFWLNEIYDPVVIDDDHFKNIPINVYLFWHRGCTKHIPYILPHQLIAYMLYKIKACVHRNAIYSRWEIHMVDVINTCWLCVNDNDIIIITLFEGGSIKAQRKPKTNQNQNERKTFTVSFIFLPNDWCSVRLCVHVWPYTHLKLTTHCCSINHKSMHFSEAIWLFLFLFLFLLYQFGELFI